MIKFDYTKGSGSTSTRLIVPTVNPTSNQSGIDVTNMDPDLALVFEQEYLTLVADFKDKTTALMRKFDVEHNYRQFKPAGMANVKTV